MILFGNYFVEVFYHLKANPEVRLMSFGDVIQVIVLAIILEAVIYSFLASADKVEEDERDKLIEKLSYRNAYWCLIVGVWFLIGHIFMESAFNNPATWVNDSLSLLTPYTLGNLLLLFFILAEVIKFITQIYYYRKGLPV